MKINNLKKLNKILGRKAFAVIFLFFLISSKEQSENKPVIVENSKGVLAYHLKGGMLKDFHLKQNPVNPFQNSRDSVESYGQSLIINASSEASINSESIKKAKNLYWDLTNSPIIKRESMEMMMKGEFLEEKITVKRWIRFPEEESIIEVKEDFLNYSETAVSFNFFQHITLNPALVKGATLYSNMDVQTKGDYKKIKDDSAYGWVIILNTKNNLLLGYLFNKNSYTKVVFDAKSKPSLILSSIDGKLSMQSKEQISKSYVTFLKASDNAMKEITALNIADGRVEIKADGGKLKQEVGNVNL